MRAGKVCRWARETERADAEFRERMNGEKRKRKSSELGWFAEKGWIWPEGGRARGKLECPWLIAVQVMKDKVEGEV